MYQVIIVIHIILGLGIIGLIMMQQGKGADAGAGFGSGASGSVFGAQGSASFLSRMTAIFATLFFITSLGLAWLNGHKNVPVIDVMGSSGQEVPQDVVLPDNKNVNPVVPQSEMPLAPAQTAAQPSLSPPAADQQPAVAAPSASTVAPESSDIPVVEEGKSVELKQESEHKASKIKKK